MVSVAAADGQPQRYSWLFVPCGNLKVYKQDGTDWRMHKPSFYFRSSKRNQASAKHQLLVMMCYHLRCWALLLLASGNLLAHPITDSAEIPFPVSGE